MRRGRLSDGHAAAGELLLLDLKKGKGRAWLAVVVGRLSLLGRWLGLRCCPGRRPWPGAF